MSQDTGIFSVRRPRETLGGISHNASAIPLPASALKRSNSISNMQSVSHTTTHARSVSGSRMSLAPGRPNQPVFQRSSSGSNLAEMATSAQRHSGTNTFSSAGGSKSYAPGMATPAASHLQVPQSTARRSSVYSTRHSSSMTQMGRQSFFTTAPVPAGVPKDPRPLRDRSYQKQLGQELSEYLLQNNFDMDMKTSLTQNAMTSPTQKDFNNMFQWLYQRIDPSYRFYKSIDAEVPPILKQLRYPYEKSITKSQISAVGGANWSTFLGVLHWMMQLAKMMDQFNRGDYDEACIEAGYDVSGDRIIFDFLTDAYHEWLAMEDDQEDKADELMQPHVQKMARRFDEVNSKYVGQMEMLEAERKAFQNQIDELGKSSLVLSKLEEQHKDYEDDKEKFEKYNASVDGKMKKYDERFKILSKEIENVEGQLRATEQEKNELQAAVDQKGMTIEDIDRMNSERDRLQQGVQTVAVRLEEAKKAAAERETDASSRLDDLESTVKNYNSLGHQLSLIPETAANAKEQKFELTLRVNAAPNFWSSKSRQQDTPEIDRLLVDANNGYQSHNLLNLDVKGTVKARVMTLRKEMTERTSVAEQDVMARKDLLDKSREAIEDKQAEVEGLRHRVRTAEEECEKTREINNAKKMTSEAQIEKLEKDLAGMRTTLGESVQLMEQREMNSNLEYEQLELRAAALREELHTEVERMLNDTIKFKVHIQKGLEDYEQFVAEEVEKELEEENELGQEGGEDVGDEEEQAYN